MWLKIAGRRARRICGVVPTVYAIAIARDCGSCVVRPIITIPSWDGLLLCVFVVCVGEALLAFELLTSIRSSRHLHHLPLGLAMGSFRGVARVL